MWRQLLIGIKNLKIGYSKIFGYYIEISKGNIAAAPAHFIRKQTLVNGERYIVQELKDFEDKILGSKEKVYQLELLLFDELKLQVSKNIKSLFIIATLQNKQKARGRAFAFLRLVH